MIVVTCLACELLIRVMPEGESSDELEHLVGSRSDFWPDKYPCPRCGKNGQGLPEREVDTRVYQVMELRDVTPKEAFAIFNGMGFPDEQQCSMETLRTLLLEHPVRRVVGRDVVGMARSIVDHLELWDGSRVYLGAATEGAVVYRITRPVSYTAKQLEAHDSGHS